MRRGFTLIELLVVMAIISILASILFPVFGRAIEKARSTACLSNIKQIQMATMMYAQDYDGRYPEVPSAGGALVWDDAILPYTENKQIVACPTLQGAPLGYGMNYWMTGAGGANARRSAEKITFADASEPVSWYIFPVGVTDPNPDGNPSTVGSNPATRHREGANFAFADGHAKWARPDLPGVADFATGWDPNS